MVDGQTLLPLLVQLRDGQVTLDYVAAEIAAGEWPYRATITDPDEMGWWVDAKDSPDRSGEGGTILATARVLEVITIEQYGVLADAMRSTKQTTPLTPRANMDSRRMP